MRIRTKLVAAFLLIPLLGGMAGYFAFENVRQVGGSFDVLHFQVVPTVSALKDAKVATLNIAASIREISSGQGSEVTAQKEQIEEYKLTFDNSMEGYDALTSTYFPEQSRHATIIGDWEVFKVIAERSVTAAENGDMVALSVLSQDFAESEEKLIASLDDAIILAESSVAEEEATFASSLENAVYLTVFILLISIAITLAIVVLILHSISKPLMDLRHVAHEISRGNFEVDVQTNRGDEIGELAADFEKMKQELKEKDRLKEEFINIAAHELRTPVLPIVLTAEELADEIDSNAREKVERIMRNARRLNKLTNDILDVSRIESNTFKINKSRMNISDLIQEVIADARTGIKNHQAMRIILQSRLSGEKQMIVADRERVHQVLTNLVGNAINITDKGTITVIIENDPESEESIRIMVTDTGKGIDASIMNSLFQKFVTGQNKAKGTGLGLFICKAIIEAHGGRIWAENNMNGGATFTFSLPISDRAHQDDSREKPLEINDLLKASHG